MNVKGSLKLCEKANKDLTVACFRSATGEVTMRGFQSVYFEVPKGPFLRLK